MADWGDVRRLALALPETSEDGSYGRTTAWRIRKKAFVWERPLRRADVEHLGDAAPAGPVLGVRVADEGTKQTLLEAAAGTCFTTSHFDGYPIVLVDLERVDDAELEELVTDAWLARAPKRVAAAWLAEREGKG